MNAARQERDAALRRLRSINTGVGFAGVAAIGLISAGVAVAVPGHSSAATTTPAATTPATSPANPGDDGPPGSAVTTVQPPAQIPAPANNPPVVTSGGS
jgi:hypothetical protein